MKKLFMTLIVLAAYLLPIIAQSDRSSGFGDGVVLVTAAIPKAEVPSAVIKAVNTHFDKNDPLTWSKFPYTLKEFGWVYEVGESEQDLSRYEVRMRTNTGNLMSGIYSKDGNLIQTRELSKNIPVPRYIMETLYGGEFSGWKVIGNKEMITFFHEKDHSIAEQNFRVIIEKGKERKRMAFNYEASTGKLTARLIR